MTASHVWPPTTGRAAAEPRPPVSGSAAVGQATAAGASLLCRVGATMGA
ncbi:hypothetical protein ACFQZ4_15180 [Catellatospora coxensis]